MRSLQISITELLDHQGESKTQQANIEVIYHRFYLDLYAARASSPDTTTNQAWVFDGVWSQLTPAMVRTLARPISLEDLTAAFQAIAIANSLGHDKVVTELYKALWPTFGANFL